MELAVIDTGRGIPAEFLPHVFDQFAQANARDGLGGLGLGLSIAKYLVEAHGGTVAASSAGPDPGATFTVSLPTLAARDAASRHSSPSGNASAHVTGGLTPALPKWAG